MSRSSVHMTSSPPLSLLPTATPTTSLSSRSPAQPRPLHCQDPVSPTVSFDTSCSNDTTLRDEKRPAFAKMISLVSASTSLKGYLKDEVNGAHTSIYLFVSFFTSGLIDSVAFNAWACFVGMQTGNTVFAALGLSGQPVFVHPNAYLKSLTSIVAFCIGTIFFSAFHHIPCWSNPNPAPSRQRFVLVCSFAIQTGLLIVTAVLIRRGFISNLPSVAGAFSSGNHLTSLPNGERPDNYKDLIAIALLAFQSSGPVFFSRVLGAIELPTIVLSTIYCDFVADLYLLPSRFKNKTSWYDFVFKSERRQIRRLCSILCLFLGGLSGGFIFQSPAGMISAIWLAAGLKGSLVVGWILWRSEDKPQQNDSV